MRTILALDYFKSRSALAKALNVSRTAVAKWAKAGIIPEGSAYKIESLTGGELKVDPKLYPSKDDIASGPPA